jgi:hypothetical protein
MIKVEKHNIIDKMNIDNEKLVSWSPESMLEIYLGEPDDFLKVKETLTRIGVSSQKEQNTLYQSCHILHKQGRYFILHFKELFLLDGKPSSFTVEDLKRRNTITTLLSDWGLVEIVNQSQLTETTTLKKIKIVPFKEKQNWSLNSKYNIGNVKKK